MKINIAVPTIHKDTRHITKISVEISAPTFRRTGVIDINITDLQGFMSNTKAVDMFLLSAFVYGIDRFVDRHAHSEDGWSRNLEVTIPVYNPEVWKSITKKLEDTISFLTGDYWKLSFIQSTLEIPSQPHSVDYAGDFGQVNLFSGGLDSLIGAVDYLTLNPHQRLLVTSHFDPNISARTEQQLLITQMRARFGDRFVALPSVSVGLSSSTWVKEKTFRSRSLLFIGIASLVSSVKNVPVIVPENGTVSLNYPLSSSRRSACSTRTTHPTFLDQVKDILLILGLAPDLKNVYDDRTKGEMVEECRDREFLLSVVGISKSCGKSGHTANWTKSGSGEQHCGVCMPCIYRQAALQNRADPTRYGNTINKSTTGRRNATPFLFSKQGQDFNACLDFLAKNLTIDQVRNELLINGITKADKLDSYVKLVLRSREELRNWVKKVGNSQVKNKAGI